MIDFRVNFTEEGLISANIIYAISLSGHRIVCKKNEIILSLTSNFLKSEPLFRDTATFCNENNNIDHLSVWRMIGTIFCKEVQFLH